MDIAGGGEIYEEMLQLLGNDNRIHYHGVLKREETLLLQQQADCFVVPRLAENYTSYSFPSKVIEYILTGKPIISHRLKCFGDNLDGVLTYIPEDGNENLSQSITKVLKGGIEVDEKKRLNFIKRNLNVNVANEIITFFS